MLIRAEEDPGFGSGGFGVFSKNGFGCGFFKVDVSESVLFMEYLNPMVPYVQEVLSNFNILLYIIYIYDAYYIL